jgi:hypothetical protein
MRMSSIKTRHDPCSRVASQPTSQPVASGDALTSESRRLFPPHVRHLLTNLCYYYHRRVEQPYSINAGMFNRRLDDLVISVVPLPVCSIANATILPKQASKQGTTTPMSLSHAKTGGVSGRSTACRDLTKP